MVVGAGVGGLVCAIALARRGFDVTVTERAARPGGKMREAAVDGAVIDAGPTVFTMRWVFDEIFEAAGASLDDYVALKPLDVLARHAWSEDERLDLFAGVNRSADAIGALAGGAEAKGFIAFCTEAKTIYETLRDTFLTAQTMGPIGLSQRIGLLRPAALMGLRPFDTLWDALGRHFRDPRLRQLFGRYATYCGSSPFEAPATLMLIAHVEQAGVWRIDGGMQRLAEALERLAASLGVAFRYGAHVERILVERDRAAGVALASGEAILGDHVVVNADAAALAGGALGAEVATVTPKRPTASRSLSAVTFAARARTQGFPLDRHNVFFSPDYAREFDDIFKHRRLPSAPTVYVCAQDRGGPGAEPADAERLLILVNAPADGDRRAFDHEELSLCRTTVLDHLKRCGLTVSLTPEMSLTTAPQDFDALFPATGGALYGPATHGWAAAFQRPGAGTRLPGLYLAGGGAHPGAGVPMAALSGRLAAEKLVRDRTSTSRSRRGATAGGMSTP